MVRKLDLWTKEFNNSVALDYTGRIDAIRNTNKISKSILNLSELKSILDTHDSLYDWLNMPLQLFIYISVPYKKLAGKRIVQNAASRKCTEFTNYSIRAKMQRVFHEKHSVLMSCILKDIDSKQRSNLELLSH